MTLGNAAAARVRLIVLVQGVRPPGRARSRRAGAAIRRRDRGPGVARAARLLCVRQPGRRHGRERNRQGAETHDAIRSGANLSGADLRGEGRLHPSEPFAFNGESIAFDPKQTFAPDVCAA
jgi:hypothetical protein